MEKENKKPKCKHQHYDGSTAFQIIGIEETKVFAEGVYGLAQVAKYICPYCNVIKAEVIG